MAAVNEWIAREYFEALGYLVSQPRKYTVPGRSKTAEEEVDLVVCNPSVRSHRPPQHLVWSAADLGPVARAVVGVRGWHTDRFYAATLEQTPEILHFAEDASVRFAAGLLGAGEIAKILCLPRLPASGETRQKLIELLQRKGLDGVLCFETMLRELVARVDVHRNYEKSDLLQVMRLLKNYDLLRDPQMELFAGKRRRAGRGPADEAPGES